MALAGPPPRRLEPVDRRLLEARLTRIVHERFPCRAFDDLEMRYLSGLASNCFLLLAEVYDLPTIERILRRQPDPTVAALQRLWDEPAVPEDRVASSLRRLRSVPDEAKVIGEKCLYDVGLFGRRQHMGYDLPELGVAAYHRASEILEDLASDARLRDYFRDDRLGGRPIEDEIIFLRQCGRSFGEYAEALSHLHLFDREGGGVAALPAGPAPAARDREGGTPGDFHPGDGEAEEEDGDPRASLAVAPAAPARREEEAGLEPVPEPEADPEFAGLDGAERLSYFERLLLFSSLDIEGLREELKGLVVDQPSAVDALCDDFSLYATGTHTRQRPLSYFFVGPTGVGKNHLVETLVRCLEDRWGQEIPLLLIEGPSYTYPSDINELKGSTRGFIRSDEEGILTEFHHRAAAAPFSVILVDEVEKAHPQLRKFFLSLMDRGTITDNRGQQLAFASTMLVYTSNLGYSRLQQVPDPIGFAGGDAREEYRRCELLTDLKRELSPEFLNRLQVVHFDPLSARSIDRIFDLELDRIAGRYRRLHGLAVTVTRAARRALLAEGYSPEYGARHLGRVLHEVCNIGVSKRLRRDRIHPAADGEEARLLGYIREARQEERAADMDMLQRRVLAHARARVPYRQVNIDHARGRFVYRTR